MSKLYPLKFKPVYKDKIWGGQKINTVLGRDFSPLPNCGEVWVLSGVEGNQTEIEDGFLEGNELNELVEIYMGELVGDKVFEQYGNEFPILIKFIDANDWLSIQVHPDDELAMERHGTLGKTEMWYILDAEKKSELISGFSTKVSKEEYVKHLDNKTLKNIMNFTPVQKGDVFYIPAGRVHALGPGILLAEIQQTDSAFDRNYFVEIASDVFFQVQAGWMRRELDSFKHLLGDLMIGEYATHLEEMRQAGHINKLESVAIRKVDVINAGSDGQEDFVTVLFTANLLDYTIDEQSGDLVAGSSTTPVKFAEEWTWARKTRSENWLLEGIKVISD